MSASTNDGENRWPARGERLTLSPTTDRWIYVLFAIGCLVFSPSIRSPLVLDDYLHASMARGTFPAPRGPFDLYDFVSDADRQILFDRGIIPWWTHPAFTIRFFRPLSSLLLWTDHRVFHGHPILLHLLPLAFWVASVFVARALYRRWFSPRQVLLATTIFALGAWHAIPLGWLANGEALIALALGLLALLSYVRWREEGRVADALLATLFFSVAMLAGEYALCFGGYCLAYEIFRREESLLRRAGSLSAYVVPAVAYLAVRGVLGYGSFGSGFYADPLRVPATFARLAPWRFVALLADGWLTIPCDSWGYGDGRWWGAGVVLVSAVPIALAIRRVLREQDAERARTLKWTLLGSLLSMTPVLSVVPAARLLGASAFGLSAMVALIVDAAWFPRGALAERRPWSVQVFGTVGLLLGFAHLVHGPGTAWLAARQMRNTAVDFIAHTEWLRDKITDPANADVMVVRAGGGMFFGPFAVDAEGRPPARWRTLSHTGHALVLRIGPRTLDIITPPYNGVFPGAEGNLFRTGDRPVHVGDEVHLPGMVARIIDMGPEAPSRVRFEFDEPVDSPALIWTAEDSLGFKSVKPPAEGFGEPFDP